VQGTISGVRYGRAWGLRLGLLLGFTFAFPFLVYALVHSSGASAIPGAAGALAVILGVYLKPLAYPLFAASIATISIARAKSAGMPGKIGAYIALLVLADLPFGIVFGSHWGGGSCDRPIRRATALLVRRRIDRRRHSLPSARSNRANDGPLFSGLPPVVLAVDLYDGDRPYRVSSSLLAFVFRTVGAERQTVATARRQPSAVFHVLSEPAAGAVDRGLHRRRSQQSRTVRRTTRHGAAE